MALRNRPKGRSLLLSGLLAALSGAWFAAGMAVAWAQQPPERIRIKGSEAMRPILEAWSQAFTQAHPDVRLDILGGGSSRGIASLIHGHADIAVSTRSLHEDEDHIAVGEGFDQPVAHRVGSGAVAIVVHRDNPLAGLDRGRLRMIFGEGGRSLTWAGLGVDYPACAGERIFRTGRDTRSGAYEQLREWLFDNPTRFTRRLAWARDEAGLALRVAAKPCAIGFGAMQTAQGGMRALCLQDQPGAPCVMPTLETAANGLYPLARPLLLITLGEPAADSTLKIFLDWTVSPQAQGLLAQAGFAPLRP